MSLSHYEARQVDAIAAWKAMRPSLLESTLGRLTESVYHRIGSAVPHTHVGTILLKSFELASKVDTIGEITKLAGVDSIDAISGWSLEQCDALADKVSLEGDTIGMAEAVASEAGGIATELANMPLQVREVILLLKRIGHCYGFAMNNANEATYLKTMVVLSHESDVPKRLELIERLRTLEKGDLSEEVVKEEDRDIEVDLASGFAEGSIMEFVPVMGTLVSVYNDYEYFHHLGQNARRVFQERRLRDQGKVDSIEPAAQAARESTVTNVYGFVKQFFYLTGYGVGFGAGYIGYGTGRLVQKTMPKLADTALEAGTKATTEAVQLADQLKSSSRGVLGLES